MIDANVAVKFVAAEPGQVEAFARVSSEATLVSPDWVLIEVGHALWRKVRAGDIDRAMAEESLKALPTLLQSLTASAKVIDRAQALSFELDHWLYDCLYLATAIDLDTALLTADRKFWNAAKRAGYGAQVELLTWPGMTS
ncbi:MAG: type II toxin-antitoxin system VapC family toxin [Qipengyuania sp.]|nr:type II toxin-antitoxin system VapC family toxin [Qipengyuania sp.]